MEVWLLTPLRSHVWRGWGGGGVITHPSEVPCLEGLGWWRCDYSPLWDPMWGCVLTPPDIISWHTQPPTHNHPLWTYPPIREGTWYQRYPPPAHKGHGTRDTHPSVNRQTLVKILPSLNFVCGGNNMSNLLCTISFSGGGGKNKFIETLWKSEFIAYNGNSLHAMTFVSVVIAVETRPPEKLVMFNLQLKDSDTHYHSLDVFFQICRARRARKVEKVGKAGEKKRRVKVN